ncbi:MAG: rod shape-determining protein RodA [Proteobacteria bacterium]|nr:rod shape-determining protein RodA [Desulfocapsa sp.]MBU3943770.1 rod shape-determining protein RodA [Pseudomonadota bacterium]MCG2742656.1 rod shape-determining protein RodA [Desulfobacteraceae bacterium]MDO8947782.1 rod shape-determining protein RodA [Desulfocapsaceae bacterium]MBU3982063.1 rod shape-determining protein RodA [Pseudomonadota bacterium]
MFRVDRRFLRNFDWVLLSLLILVCGMAFLNLYSASYPPLGGMPPYQKQGYLLLMGVAGIIFLISFDYKELHLWNYPVYLLVILLLALVIFFGNSAGGAQRWINLGFFQLQPSEPAKLMMVITLASYYSRKEVVNGYSIQDLITPIILMAIPFILILIQPDLGTALMFVIIFISMTVFAKLRWSSYLILGFSGIALSVVGWFYVLKPYQKQRVETLLNPAKDSLGEGYQILQSKIAVGSGGIFGKGYMEGTQGHLHFLPERHTDFAFSVWCEEWGFSGSLFFLGVYFFLLFWGLHVAMSARDRFGLFLAFGVVALIFWQAVINLLMILGFLPVVGIPLPLFSYGGSSLLTTLLGIGILMNVSMRRFQTDSSLEDCNDM